MQRKARGSVECRGKAWELRVTVQGQDKATGKVVQHRLRVPLGTTTELRSEAAARRVADAWIARRFPERLSTGDQILTAAYLERFLKLHVVVMRSSTQRLYRSIVRNHLVPALGSLPLARVGVGDIREMIAGLIAAGRKRATIINTRSVLFRALDQAEADGFDVQQIDPRKVKVPKSNEAEREQRHITPEEMDLILAGSDPRHRALYALMGLLGLRISEALGMAWQHLELDGDAPLARIRQSAAGGRLYPLKSKASRAPLPLPADLVGHLRLYRMVWVPNPDGLLFATSSGRPARAEYIRRAHWGPLLERLGLPHGGFHAFRHGLPRRLFAAGCSASVVRQLMRHSSLTMTERYTHATAEDLRAAQQAAESRRKPSPSLPEMTQGGRGAGILQGSGN